MAESTRDKLLAATMDHVAKTGLADFSLRSVAAAIGTSHRMLSHHFGSKAGLETAIVQCATELMTAPLLTAEAGAEDLSAAEQVRRIWEALSDPGLAPLIRLYFDLTNKATNGDPVASTAVETIRDRWAQTVITLSDDPDDSKEHLLGAAVTSTFLKGLLLDSLTGASLADTDDVLQRFTDLIESYQG